MSQQIKVGSAPTGLAPYVRYIAEWFFWIALIGLYFQQTSHFGDEISNYRFGADGWPRGIALAALLGATFQLVLQLHSLRSGPPSSTVEHVEELPVSKKQWALRFMIFAWPFVFLYLMPRLGAYVSLPIFIVGFLLLLGVRKIKPISLVLLVVYGLTLLIFTRFFFVALPLGNEGTFYDINVAIIEFARLGR
ncbi:tripartite tricarboxylate transporter TctB family protein [Roseovarius sp. A-2]|uniref:tripartite tricarboxylate transporter TctB family protein n=1 Tax=Roseovarius sp. A-2 TaxID=1570360 RepID=UPI0009B5338B|nr:tripartite tricarboxylate transporter TctB family protein [Roseovarius sp. A-2]GAW37345.1 tripartite tricarboxylate transporter TctB family protein [Roseovarius sp. A-2]